MPSSSLDGSQDEPSTNSNRNPTFRFILDQRQSGDHIGPRRGEKHKYSPPVSDSRCVSGDYNPVEEPQTKPNDEDSLFGDSASEYGAETPLSEWMQSQSQIQSTYPQRKEGPGGSLGPNQQAPLSTEGRTSDPHSAERQNAYDPAGLNLCVGYDPARPNLGLPPLSESNPSGDLPPFGYPRTWRWQEEYEREQEALIQATQTSEDQAQHLQSQSQAGDEERGRALSSAPQQPIDIKLSRGSICDYMPDREQSHQHGLIDPFRPPLVHRKPSRSPSPFDYGKFARPQAEVHSNVKKYACEAQEKWEWDVLQKQKNGHVLPALEQKVLIDAEARRLIEREPPQRPLNEEVGAGRGAEELKDEEPDEDVFLAARLNHPECDCGCHITKCTCHPLHCGCSGCDHREEADRLRGEAERKWGHREAKYEGWSEEDEDEYEPREAGADYEGEHGPERGSCCGSGNAQKKCVCSPGLCRCVGCEEYTGVPNDHFSQGFGPSREDHNCPCRSGGTCHCAPGQCKCNKSRFAPEPRPLQSQQHMTSTSPCRAGEDCTCQTGKCKCRKTQSGPEPWSPQGKDLKDSTPVMTGALIPSQGNRSLHLKLSEMVEPPFEGSTTPLDTPPLPSGSFSRPTLKVWESNEPPISGTTTPLATPRPRSGSFFQPSASKVAPPSVCDSTTPPDTPPHGTAHLLRPTASGMAPPSFSRQGSMPPSRPDTPRPQLDSAPPTPYAAEVLQDYVQQSVELESTVLRGYQQTETQFARTYYHRLQCIVKPDCTPYSQDSVRQSVEPEYPPPNWARESTPAYEDRSLTPSPCSGSGDVVMRDVSQDTIVPSNSGRQASVPPPRPGDRGSISPQRPVPPPVPESSIKQPKRADRRKSGVQGSKVEKRSTTASKPVPKSRNVTRKPTASVGKLVEKAKKENKEAAKDAKGESEAVPNKLPRKADGKVSAAVKKIEDQVKQEEKKKQKDGSPLRRSVRANKGVRTSLGHESS